MILKKIQQFNDFLKISYILSLFSLQATLHIEFAHRASQISPVKPSSQTAALYIPSMATFTQRIKWSAVKSSICRNASRLNIRIRCEGTFSRILLMETKSGNNTKETNVERNRAWRTKTQRSRTRNTSSTAPLWQITDPIPCISVHKRKMGV